MRVKAGIVNALNGHDRLGHPLRDDKEIVHRLVTGGQDRGRHRRVHDVEDIGAYKHLRRDAPVTSNDPRSTQGANSRSERLQQREVALGQPFGVAEVDGHDVDAAACNTANPRSANPMSELAGDETIVRANADRGFHGHADPSGAAISSRSPGGINDRIPPFAPEGTLLGVSSIAAKHPQLLRDNDFGRGAT